MFGRKADRIMELEAQVNAVRLVCEAVVANRADEKMPAIPTFEDGKSFGYKAMAMSILNGLNQSVVANERRRK